MFAQTDIFSLDKWVMVGKDLGIGTMFALVLLALCACGSFYVLRASFGKQGFVRDCFAGVKDAAVQFLARLTQTLDRLESAAAESREYHKQQAAACQAMIEAHTAPRDPAISPASAPPPPTAWTPSNRSGKKSAPTLPSTSKPPRTS